MNVGKQSSTVVSRETSELLETHLRLLRKWSPKINLVSASSLEHAETRHTKDSVQILNHIPADTKTYVDLGTGGGFPGLVIAILMKERMPHVRTHLVESDTRKATFLRTVIRETGLQTVVHTERIETLQSLNADAVSARALAPLPPLLGLAYRHLAKDGHCLFLKGQSWQKELQDASSEWQFSHTAHTSESDANAVLLDIRDLSHA